MKQKYWFNRSLSQARNNQQEVENTLNINRQRNHKLIFYNESAKKQLSEINEQARKLNSHFYNLKQQNKLYHDINLHDNEVKNEVRCLKHNSVIILYCFTDNKLLCSNCVYATGQHAKHRVNQAKSAASKIEQVLISNEKTVRDRIYEINNIRNFFQDIQKKMENIKQIRLEKLERDLQQYSGLLCTLYEKNKRKLIQTFQLTKQEVSCFVEQMRQLSRNMKSQHSLIAVRQLHVQQIMEQLNKISGLIPPKKLGQNLLQTLSNYGKAVASSFRYGFSNLSK